MPRIKFANGLQAKFLFEAKGRLGFNWTKFAQIINTHPRCLSDWRRERYTIPESIFVQILNLIGGNVQVPPYKILPNFWNIQKAARKGGQVLARNYGGPGTEEGRRKGGRISQKRRRENPEKYRQLGCNVKKVFIKPCFSPKLAEIVGIILGDGAINDFQIRVTLDRNTDRDYSIFVRDLMHGVFNEYPRLMERKECNTIDLTISGVGLIEILEELGLQRGNKVLHQVDLPRWIRKKRSYKIACIRGLFDTDGGLYIHKKEGKKYLGWCFSNSAKPLLNSVRDILINLGFNVKKSEENKLYMYDLKHIKRYMRVISSNNPKNILKLLLVSNNR